MADGESLFGEFSLSNLPDHIRALFAPENIPLVLNPIPGSLEDLRQLSERSYFTLLAGLQVQQLIIEETAGDVIPLLTGSLAIAAMAGYMYREVHDVDFFLPRDQLAGITALLTSKGYALIQIQGSMVYQITHIVNDPQDATMQHTVLVDFFVYDPVNTMAIIGRNDLPISVILGSHPLVAKPYYLYGFQLLLDPDATANFKANDDSSRRLTAAYDKAILVQIDSKYAEVVYSD